MPALKLNSKRFFIALMLALLLMQVLPASAEDLYLYPLKSLVDRETRSLADYQGHARVAVVFQPDCPWCEKQIADLARLEHQCGGAFSTVLIGTRGKRSTLKRELRKFATSMPALKADRGFMRLLKGFEATPVTLFFDRAGKLLANRRGYIPPEKLKRAISLQTGGLCS
ncbi:TlpA family protein disulfide reductase [Thalassomonas haliotis]|uniref:Thioredoxin-like fold domain-containing protein n=1 Tax=Thalassomonas haliotis TaxID=485448 RepID=A0ABY7VDH0_9GAMM|nr:thioredoxin fold domain-containing protein [Thalassomonas haliotis]WDE11669.1 hypothetical protein H3N35_26315 [Thalassomonas haliotis]